MEIKTLLVCALLAACSPPAARSDDKAAADKIREKLKAIPMAEKVNLTNDEWKLILTPNQFHIMRESGTEPPFHNEYWDNHAKGVYVCAACGNPLFDSGTKFESGTGWPSFYQPIKADAIHISLDDSLGMARDEVSCARCGAHLGHVFDDGPEPTHQRFCMDSASLLFMKAESAESKK